MSEPSQQFQQIAAAIPKDFNIASDDVAAVRAKMKPWHGHPIAADTEVRFTNAHSIKMAWLTAASCSDRQRYALFCHGGGFVSCSAEEYLFFAEQLSQRHNCTVLVPDYRLAPEHLFPAALEDCFLAYQSLLEAGIASSSVFFTGDSCGGGLAASTLLRARDQSLPLPACFLGMTGWYDLQLNDALVNAPRTEPMITPGWFRNRVKDYLGNADPAQVYASPALAECSALPPLLLQVGSNDLSLHGAKQFTLNAQAAGVHAELDVYQGMVQGFHGLIGSGVPESTAAWEAARRFIDVHIPVS